MKILVYGAGPTGCFYTHFLNEAGKDVTLLARGKRLEFLKNNGLILEDEISGRTLRSRPKLIGALGANDEYDLVIVLVRKNKLEPVFANLAKCNGIKRILFMGNNALGFSEYARHLPEEKLLFGFPGLGGGIRDNVVHFADRERAGGKRREIVVGQADGSVGAKMESIRKMFESSQIPVCVSRNIDGWLKYHAAIILPLANRLYIHDCDTNKLAEDKESLRVVIRAAKEGGRVLKALGYSKREPFQYNLFYWLPEFLNVQGLQRLLRSKFAEVAFSLHALAPRDEFRELAADFDKLVQMTNIETPSINGLLKCGNRMGRQGDYVKSPLGTSGSH